MAVMISRVVPRRCIYSYQDHYSIIVVRSTEYVGLLVNCSLFHTHCLFRCDVVIQQTVEDALSMEK